MYDLDMTRAPIVWDHSIYEEWTERKPVFAYYDYDGFITCTSPVKRAVKLTVDRLTKAGYKCLPIDMTKYKFMEYYIYILFAGDFPRGVLHGEKMIEDYDEAVSLEGLPSFVPKILAKILAIKGDVWSSTIIPIVTNRD